jgi:integrase
VHEITRRDVRELIEQIAETCGLTAANRAFQHVGRFFNVLVERDVIAASPCIGLKKPGKEATRERVLTEAEIRSLMTVLDVLRGPACAAIKLLLLTGQRRSEVAGMAWSEIDGDTWLLAGARTKNGKAHAVPLSRQARAVIEQQPRISGCDFVFSSGSKPVANFSRVKKEIDKIMRPEAPWVVHDLRRTCASHMARLGITLPVIEKLLNHASGSFRGIVSVYQRHDYANEKRAALAAWGREVERIVKGESAKIVKLR